MADTAVVAGVERPRVELSRHVAFVVLAAAAVAWSWKTVATVVALSLNYGQEHYSHIIAIPFMSLFVFYVDRVHIFAEVRTASWLGALVTSAGLGGAWVPFLLGLQGESAWSVAILSMVTACIGAFILCYGLEAFKQASFPLLLLVLMAPFPPAVLQAIVGFLQYHSADATAVIFELIGVPFFREGFLFSLPGINIMIAEECSGIRSSLALFIMSLLAGHLFLRRAWSRTALVLLVIPLAIVKNAVRIVVLTMLAIHVDPSFITGSATHRYSGVPLFAVSFLIMGGIIWLLQKSEARMGNRR